MTEEGSPTTEISQPRPDFSGFWVRYAAFTVDGFILGILYLLGVFTITSLSGQGFSASEVDRFELSILLPLVCAYNIFFITKNGATPGKKFFKIKVLQTNHKPVSLGKVVLRETVGKLLSSLVFNLGYIWAGVDSKKQTWHDKIAKTYVVYTESLSRGRKALAAMVAFLLPGLAILGIVVSLLLINPAKQIDKARDAARKSDIIALGQGLELYHTENGVYPPNLSKITKWVSQIPTDPETGEDYLYQVTVGGESYILRTTLSTGEKYEVGGGVPQNLSQ